MCQKLPDGSDFEKDIRNLFLMWAGIESWKSEAVSGKISRVNPVVFIKD